jgi:hypothetical protein
MRAWHYNIVRIIKNPDFKETLLRCLRSIEGFRDHTLVLGMLSNYFSLRNKNFGSNWVNLPTSRVTLYINKSGIYFLPDLGFSKVDIPRILELNAEVYAAIGRSTWVLTFNKIKSPTKKDILCHLASQKRHSQRIP